MEWISILIQVHECRDQTYQAHIYGIVDICNIFYIYTMSIKYKWIHKFSEVIRCYYTAVNERYYMSFRWSFTALFSFEIIGGKNFCSLYTYKKTNFKFVGKWTIGINCNTVYCVPAELITHPNLEIGKQTHRKHLLD